MAIEYNKPPCPGCGKTDQVRRAYGVLDVDARPAKMGDVWVCNRYECGFQAIKEVEGELH